jgi:hypothetical protein
MSAMTTPGATMPSDDDLITLAEQLIASWNARASMDVRMRDDPTLTKVGVGYALTAHVHRLAAVIIRLVRDGLVLEAVPLVRAICRQWE